MALTEMQKKIIIDNPRMKESELADLAKCSERTVIRYRKNYHQSKQNVTKKVTKSINAPARDCTVHDNIVTKDMPIMTPQDILQIGSEVCATEVLLYRMSVESFVANPNDYNNQSNVKSHAESLLKGLSFMSKATGLEKEATINVLNVNQGLNDVQMDRLIQLSKKRAHPDGNLLQ